MQTRYRNRCACLCGAQGGGAVQAMGCLIKWGEHVTTEAISWVAQSLQGLLMIFMELFAAEEGRK